MTSMPASRSARATTFAPRSCPSSPGLAMRTRMRCFAGVELIRWFSVSPRRGPPWDQSRVERKRERLADADTREIRMRGVEDVVELARHDHAGYAQGRAPRLYDPSISDRLHFRRRWIVLPDRGEIRRFDGVDERLIDLAWDGR